MEKIPSLFTRTHDGAHLVRNEVTPGAEWVLTGLFPATQKHDGTCCLWREGRLWKRYELKRGKLAPPGFLPAQDPDSVTGAVPGWVAVGDGPEDQWHREALQQAGTLTEGTYELCGPKIQGNPEQVACLQLIPHGSVLLLDAPVDYDDLREYLATHAIEGIVWYHHDGRRAKIKGKDFGLIRRRGEAGAP